MRNEESSEPTREELLAEIEKLETELKEAQTFGGKTKEEYYEDKYAA